MKKIIILSFTLIGSVQPFFANSLDFSFFKDDYIEQSVPCTSPVVKISHDTTICEGDTATLTATGGGNYLWSNGETTSSIKVVPLITTTYSVKVTVDTCSANASTTVTVVSGPYGCYITPTTATICPGSGGVNFALAGPAGPYKVLGWNPSNGLSCNSCNNPNANPNTSTTYTVTIEDIATSCTKIVTVPVIVSNSLTASITGADSICKGSSTILTASGGSKYLWNNGDTTNIITVNPVITTVYSLKVSSGSCSDSAKFILKVDSCSPLGINPLVQNKTSVVLFPNPGTGVFKVELSAESAAYSIEIYNILGKKVYSEMLNQVQHDYAIDISNQPSGIYFYRVVSENGNLIGTGKVMVQK